MFIENKYHAMYLKIIENAKKRILPKTIKIEKHHIIPRSLGRKDVSTNIVKVTPREHFICHRILARMTVGVDKSKMNLAVV